MPLITDEKANLVGCIIREITHDTDGWHIIVQRDDEVFDDVMEIYPVLNHDGPNTIVRMHVEYLTP
jgi:hypothetical protein